MLIFYTIAFVLTFQSISNGFSSKYKSRKIKNTQSIGSKSSILYRKSALPLNEFDLIKKDLMKSSNNDKVKLPLQKEHKSSIARLRTGVTLPNNSKTVQILTNPNGAIAQLINKHFHDNGSAMVYKTETPVEVRSLSNQHNFTK